MSAGGYAQPNTPRTLEELNLAPFLLRLPRGGRVPASAGALDVASIIRQELCEQPS